MTSALRDVARRADAEIDQARASLVRAVRAAAAQGMTQAQIAREIGRSQPEVSRLLHLQGTSPSARNLRRHARDIRKLVADAGGSQVRVFGSVARGEEQQGSDVDLLFTMREPLSLMELGRLERRIANLLGVAVDLVPESALRPDLRQRVLAEAVLL